MAATVLLQSLGGTWEWVGSDRRAGVWHENLVAEADAWGPSKASFVLKRDPRALFPDLSAFTPVDIHADGVPVWSGRVSETPTRDGVDRAVSVQADGWQYHLDDDQYYRQYVHTNLSDYKDTRSAPGAQLASYIAGGQVGTDRGVIQLAYPNATPAVAADNRVGVTLDMGPDAASRAKRIVIAWQSSNNAAAVTFFARNGDTDDSLGVNVNDAFTFAMNTGASGTTAGTFATARRYVHLFLYVGAVGTIGGDIWIKLTSIQVYSDPAYESGNASILKASTIIQDALTRATVLLSADQTSIAASSFSFPSFGSLDPRTPREVWNAVNSVEDRVSQIDVYRRPIFAVKPTIAAFEIGDWSAATFEDASANSGDDIYNRALVTGTQPDGVTIIGDRSSGEETWAVAAGITNPAPTNASFDTNTTGWTASGGSITRDTGVFDTTPASGRWDRGAGVNLNTGDTLTATFTGTFLAGTTYVLNPRVRPSVAFALLGVTFGTTTATITGTSAVAFNSGVAVWTPAVSTTSVTVVFTVTGVGPAAWWYIDTLALSASKPTLVDRREFRRTKALTVNNPLTSALATQLADTYLAGHRTAQLKGTVQATGRTAIRDILTGAHIPPERMLLHTMKLLRLSHRTDPDTGGLGRDGRIVNARVDFEQGTVDLTLDNTRENFESLLARLAVVIGAN